MRSHEAERPLGLLLLDYIDLFLGPFMGLLSRVEAAHAEDPGAELGDQHLGAERADGAEDGLGGPAADRAAAGGDRGEAEAGGGGAEEGGGGERDDLEEEAGDRGAANEDRSGAWHVGGAGVPAGEPKK